MTFAEYKATAAPDADLKDIIKGYRGETQIELLRNGDYDEQLMADVEGQLLQHAADGGVEMEGFDSPDDNEESLVARHSLDTNEPEMGVAANRYKALKDPTIRQGYSHNPAEYAEKLEAARIEYEAAAPQEKREAARRAALSRGDIPFAAFTDKEGNRRVELGSEILSTAGDDQALAEVFAANPNLDRSLIGEVRRKLQTPEGFNVPLATLERQQDFTAAFDAVAPTLAYQLDGIKRAIAEGKMDNLDVSLGDIDMTLSGTPLAEQFTPEERKAFVTDYATRNAPIELDPENPEKNLRTLSTGEVHIPTPLMMNKATFDKVLPSLPEAQRPMAEAHREQVVSAYAKDAFKTITARRPEFADEYAEQKATGKTDAEILDAWTADPKNQSTAYEYLSGIAESIPAALVTAAAAIPALSGNKTAASLIRHFDTQTQQRKEFANLVGKDLGVGYDIGTMIAPVVVDIFATKGAAAVARGTAGAAARMAIKPVVRGFFGATVRQETKGLVNSFVKGSVKRELEREGLGALPGAAASLRPTEVLGAVGRDIEAGLTRAEFSAGMFASGFNRAAGASYVSTYSTLEGLKNPDGSRKFNDEQVRDMAVKHATTVGTMTGLTTLGFNAMGAPGIEAIFSGGLTRKQAAGVFTRLKKDWAGMAPAVREGVDMTSADTMIASMMSKSLKPLWKVGVAGATEEFPEEATQQFLEDIAIANTTGEKFDVNKSLRGALYAGMLGGVMGGGATVTADVVSSPEVDARREAAVRRSALLSTAAKLDANPNLKATADAVRQLALNGIPQAPAKADVPEGVPAAGAESAPSGPSVADPSTVTTNDSTGTPNQSGAAVSTDEGDGTQPPVAGEPTPSEVTDAPATPTPEQVAAYRADRRQEIVAEWGSRNTRSGLKPGTPAEVREELETITQDERSTPTDPQGEPAAVPSVPDGAPVPNDDPAMGADNAGLDAASDRKQESDVNVEGVDALIANGGGTPTITYQGEQVPFDDFVVTVDGTSAEVFKVKIGDRSGKFKGVGTLAYVQLGKQLAAKGITLSSSKAQYADGLKVWQRLAKMGYAKKTAQGFDFIAAPEGAEGQAMTAGRFSGKATTAQEAGMTTSFHAGNLEKGLDSVDTMRVGGAKQGKKGRTYGGFYIGPQETAAKYPGTKYQVNIRPEARVLNLAQKGAIERLSIEDRQALLDSGIDIVSGVDIRGVAEQVVINKAVIESVKKEGDPQDVTAEKPAATPAAAGNAPKVGDPITFTSSVPGTQTPTQGVIAAIDAKGRITAQVGKTKYPNARVVAQDQTRITNPEAVLAAADIDPTPAERIVTDALTDSDVPEAALAETPGGKEALAEVINEAAPEIITDGMPLGTMVEIVQGGVSPNVATLVAAEGENILTFTTGNGSSPSNENVSSNTSEGVNRQDGEVLLDRSASALQGGQDGADGRGGRGRANTETGGEVQGGMPSSVGQGKPSIPLSNTRTTGGQRPTGNGSALPGTNGVPETPAGSRSAVERELDSFGGVTDLATCLKNVAAHGRPEHRAIAKLLSLFPSPPVVVVKFAQNRLLDAYMHEGMTRAQATEQIALRRREVAGQRGESLREAVEKGYKDLAEKLNAQIEKAEAAATKASEAAAIAPNEKSQQAMVKAAAKEAEKALSRAKNTITKAVEDLNAASAKAIKDVTKTDTHTAEEKLALGFITTEGTLLMQAVEAATTLDEIAQAVAAWNANTPVNIDEALAVGFKDRAPAGYFSPRTGQIILNSENTGPSGAVGTLLHELIHAATESSIQNPTPEQARVLKRIDGYRKTLKARAEKAGLNHLAYGLGSNSEFFAHFMESAAFQREIDSLTKKGDKSFVQLIIEAIRDLLNGKTTKKSDVVTEDIVRAMIEFTQSAADLKYGRHAMTTDGKVLMLPAHHGTPHKVVGGFTTDKIGTGEGAQAFGWGLYFAGDEKVAKWYKDALSVSGRVISWEYDGRPLADPSMSDTPEQAELSKALMNVEQTTSRPHADAVANLEMTIRLNENHEVGKTYNPARRKALAMLKAMDPEKLKVYRSEPGNLYTVEILPDEDQFLDWDKPLSEQSDSVKQAVTQSFFDYIESSEYKALPWGKNDIPREQHTAEILRMSGREHYNSLTNRGMRPDAASKLLGELGIPGIKFLDGNSRSRPFRDIKRDFTNVLPEDAEIDDVLYAIENNEFNPEQVAFLKALEADDWLGFEYPAQAISAALSDNISNWDPSPALLNSIDPLRGNVTRNYVIFDGKDIVITHENGVPVSPEVATAPAPGPYGTARMDALMQMPEDVRDEVRFAELTESLGEAPTQADIDSFKAENAAAYAELKAMRERVLRGAGYNRKAYHGSDEAFTQFDKTLLGKKTGAASAKKMFFATSDERVARTYAGGATDLDEYSGVVTEILLKIESPIIQSMDDVEYEGQGSLFSKLVNKAIREGDDGVIFEDVVDQFGGDDLRVISDIFAFPNPEQAKSTEPLSLNPATSQLIGPSQWGDTESPSILFQPSEDSQEGNAFNQEVQNYVTGNWPSDPAGRYSELTKFTDGWVARYGDAFKFQTERSGLGQSAVDVLNFSEVRLRLDSETEPTIVIRDGNAQVASRDPAVTEEDAKRAIAFEINEEVIHRAFLEGVKQRYGTYRAAVDYSNNAAGNILDYAEASGNYDEVNRVVSDALEAHQRGETHPNHVGRGLDVLRTYTQRDPIAAFRAVNEIARQMVQARRNGTLSEESTLGLVAQIKQWLVAKVKALKVALHNRSSLGPALEMAVEDTEKVMDDLGILFQPSEDPAELLTASHEEGIAALDNPTDAETATLREHHELTTTGNVSMRQRAQYRVDATALDRLVTYLRAAVKSLADSLKASFNMTTAVHLDRLGRELAAAEDGYKVRSGVKAFDPNAPLFQLSSDSPDAEFKWTNFTEVNEGNKLYKSTDADEVKKGWWARMFTRRDDLRRPISALKVDRKAQVAVIQQKVDVAERLYTQALKAENPNMDTVRRYVGSTAPLLTPEEETRLDGEYQSRLEAAESISDVNLKAETLRQTEEWLANAKNRSMLKRAKELRAQRDLAGEELARTSPLMYDAARRFREATDELQAKLAKDYKDSHEDLSWVIDRSNGIYLVRSYKFHQDPMRAEKLLHDPAYAELRDRLVDFFGKHLADDAFAELRNDPANAGEPDSALMAVARNNVRDVAQAKFEDYIKGHEGAHTMGNFAEGVRIEIERFMKKKNLAPEIAELLGEIDDPLFNAKNTLIAVSNILFTHRMNKAIREDGLRTGTLITAEQQASNTKYRHWQPLKSVSENSQAYYHLGGLYASPEDKKAFDAAFNSSRHLANDTAGEAMDTLNKFILGASGKSMGIMILGNPGTYVRNVIGNSLIAMSQGANPFSAKGHKSAMAAYDMVRGQGKGDEEFIEKMIAYRILGDGVNVNYMREFMKQYRENPLGAAEWAASKGEGISPEAMEALRKAGSGWGKMVAALSRTSEFTETYIGPLIFLNELDALVKAGMPQLEAEQEAARITKMVTPGQTEVAQAVTGFSKHPISALVAPFLRFKSEMFRTVVNTWVIGYQHLKSENPALRAHGARRLASAGIIQGGVTIMMPLILQALSGISDEEDQLIRASMPAYAKNSSFWYRRNSDGSLQTWDLTFTIPYSINYDVLTQSLKAGINGRWSDITPIWARLITDEIIGEQIVAGTLLDVARNKDETTGNELWLDVDGLGERAYKAAMHVVQGSYTPALVKKSMQAVQALDRPAKEDEPFFFTPAGIMVGMAAPVKPRDHDLNKLATRAFRSVTEANRQLWLITSKLASPQGMSEGEAAKLYQERTDAHVKNWTRAYKYAMAARSMGMTTREVMMAMKDADMSQERSQLALQGKTNIKPLPAETMKKVKEIDPARYEELVRATRQQASRIDLRD